MRVCNHGCDVTLSVSPANFKAASLTVKLGKKGKERRTTALVNNLDEFVKWAQAMTTKYATKYAVNVFKVIFAFNYNNKILKIILFFFKKCTIKLIANSATDCECFEIQFYVADRLPCFGCQMFKK